MAPAQMTLYKFILLNFGARKHCNTPEIFSIDLNVHSKTHLLFIFYGILQVISTYIINNAMLFQIKIISNIQNINRDFLIVIV